MDDTKQDFELNGRDFGFKKIIDTAADGVIVTLADQLDPPGPRIIYVNKAMTELSGYSAQEMLGQSPRLLQGEKTSITTRILIRQHLEKKQPLRCRILNYRKDGSSYWAELSIMPLTGPSGDVTHFASIQRDITAYKKIEDLLLETPNVDAETNLMSRPAFIETLEKEWRRAFRHHSIFTLLMLRLKVNGAIPDSLNADQLKLISRICQDSFRLEDSVGRTDKNEFCVLMPENDLTSARRVLARVNQLFLNQKLKEPQLQEAGLSLESGAAELLLLDDGPQSVMRRARKEMEGRMI